MTLGQQIGGVNAIARFGFQEPRVSEADWQGSTARGVDPFSLATFIALIHRCLFPAGHLFRNSLEMRQLEAIGRRDPNWNRVRIGVVQAKSP